VAAMEGSTSRTHPYTILIHIVTDSSFGRGGNRLQSMSPLPLLPCNCLLEIGSPLCGVDSFSKLYMLRWRAPNAP